MPDVLKMVSPLELRWIANENGLFVYSKTNCDRREDESRWPDGGFKIDLGIW